MFCEKHNAVTYRSKTCRVCELEAEVERLKRELAEQRAASCVRKATCGEITTLNAVRTGNCTVWSG